MTAGAKVVAADMKTALQGDIGANVKPTKAGGIFTPYVSTGASVRAAGIKEGTKARKTDRVYSIAGLRKGFEQSGPSSTLLGATHKHDPAKIGHFFMKGNWKTRPRKIKSGPFAGMQTGNIGVKTNIQNVENVSATRATIAVIQSLQTSLAKL